LERGRGKKCHDGVLLLAVAEEVDRHAEDVPLDVTLEAAGEAEETAIEAAADVSTRDEAVITAPHPLIEEVEAGVRQVGPLTEAEAGEGERKMIGDFEMKAEGVVIARMGLSEAVTETLACPVILMNR